MSYVIVNIILFLSLVTYINITEHVTKKRFDRTRLIFLAFSIWGVLTLASVFITAIYLATGV